MAVLQRIVLFLFLLVHLTHPMTVRVRLLSGALKRVDVEDESTLHAFKSRLAQLGLLEESQLEEIVLEYGNQTSSSDEISKSKSLAELGVKPGDVISLTSSANSTSTTSSATKRTGSSSSSSSGSSSSRSSSSSSSRKKSDKESDGTKKQEQQQKM